MKKSDFVVIKAVITIIMSAAFAAGAISFLRDTGKTGADAVEAMIPSRGEIITIDYTEDAGRFANPERGWYRSYFTDDLWGFAQLHEQGISVVQLKADLGQFLDSPVSEKKIDEIRSAFRSARKYGTMVIFRAAYDFTGKNSPEPADMDIIETHIRQMGHIFDEFESILWFVQAGFLGPWGEWHSSRFGDIPSPESRERVIRSLLDAVPESRAIQVRRPVFIRDLIEGGMDESSVERIGYHNDAFVSSDNDCGTYSDPGHDRMAELEWAGEKTRHAPFAGETVMSGSLSDPQNAVSELDKLNALSLNIDYHPDVISKWKNTMYLEHNTFKYISDNLGYRFVIVRARLNTVLMPEDTMKIDMYIQNNGFGNLINKREVEFILRNGKSEYVFTSSEDPRMWEKERGTIRVVMEIKIPAEARPGKWSLYISLPGTSQEVSKDPAYSVRFANKNIWDSRTGHNLLTDDILITASDPIG